MNFSWFETLLLLGIFQGCISSVLLWRSPNNTRSNKYLAFALLSFSAVAFKMLLNSSGVLSQPPWSFFPIATELACPALIYLYAVSLLQPRKKFRAASWWHLLPFFLLQSYAVFIWISVLPENSKESQQAIAAQLGYQPIKQLEDWLLVIMAVAYLTIGFRKLSHYRSNMHNYSADLSLPTLHWLAQILVLITLLITLLVTNMVVDRLFQLESWSILHWKMYFLFMALVIYTLGFKGYQQQQIPPQVASFVEPASREKLPQDKAEQLALAFEKEVLAKQRFLEPTLSIQSLAKSLDVNQSNLSYSINQHFKMSFRDYINQQRVTEVKKRLQQPDSTSSILAIALDCGFNSEASFYRAFKKHTGLTPKQFLAQQ